MQKIVENALKHILHEMLRSSPWEQLTQQFYTSLIMRHIWFCGP